MQIAEQKYNSGDLVVIKDKEYKSVYACGTQPFLASVVFYGNGREFKIKYGRELDTIANSVRLILPMAELYDFPIFDLEKYILVVPFDRDYAVRKYGGDYLMMEVGKISPVAFQRDSIHKNLSNNGEYKIHKINCTYTSRVTNRQDIYFHLKEVYEGYPMTVTYAEFIKNFEVCGLLSEL